MKLVSKTPSVTECPLLNHVMLITGGNMLSTKQIRVLGSPSVMGDLGNTVTSGTSVVEKQHWYELWIALPWGSALQPGGSLPTNIFPSNNRKALVSLLSGKNYTLHAFYPCAYFFLDLLIKVGGLWVPYLKDLKTVLLESEFLYYMNVGDFWDGREWGFSNYHEKIWRLLGKENFMEW